MEEKFFKLQKDTTHCNYDRIFIPRSVLYTTIMLFLFENLYSISVLCYQYFILQDKLQLIKKNLKALLHYLLVLIVKTAKYILLSYHKIIQSPERPESNADFPQNKNKSYKITT